MSERRATVERNTLETQIRVSVNLDGTGVSKLDTGLPFLEHMLDQVARHGLIDLEIEAKGDLHIDAHHTVEDIGITLGQALAARPSTAPASTERPKTGDRPQTARDKRRFADSIPRIPLAPTYQGERPPRRVPWALGAVFTTVTDEDLKRYKQKQRSRRRGKSLHTMYALSVRTALLMRKVREARQRRKDAFQRDLAQRQIAASWRKDNPVKRRRKRAEKIIHGPVLASLGKNARLVIRNRSVDRIKFFLGEAQHLPPFKLVMVKFLHAVRNCQRIWRHKLRPHFAMIEVLGRAMDRAQERHRTDLIYFGNLVSACVLRGQRRVDGVEPQRHRAVTEITSRRWRGSSAPSSRRSEI